MKFICAALAFVFAAAPLVASPADSDKLLQNLFGDVTYQSGSATAQSVAPKASIALADNDFAITGVKSQAAISLPDSSRVLIGENSRVQLTSFNSSGIATAKFVVVGKARFKVEHVAGAQANYTFQTSTGQIAVRGTEGDILSNPNGLQVNVYTVSNPALPVQVTLANGQVFTLNAGQALIAHAVAGAIVGASVASVSQSLFSPFVEFGAPANASAMGITAVTTAGAASSAAVTTAAAATIGAAAAITTIANGNKGSSPSATATPAPTATTTPVPVVISGAPQPGVPSQVNRPGAPTPIAPIARPGMPVAHPGPPDPNWHPPIQPPQ